MKIVYLIHHFGLGADHWISSGWKSAYEENGHEFHLVTALEDYLQRIREIKPDILWAFPWKPIMGESSWPIFKELRSQGTKVFLMVDDSFNASLEKLRFYRESDIADVYWGENEAEWMTAFELQTGRKYVTIPLAADGMVYKPTPPVKKFSCDIAYVGAIMPFKREAFQKLLFPLMKKYHVRVYGPGWTNRDKFLRVSAAALRSLGAIRLGNFMTNLRISLSREEENQLYSSAKICVNIHERGPEQANHVFLNERGFKIPASGGFEICDYNRALRRYFSEDEVVMANDDTDWFDKIDYYIAHEQERLKIRERGALRAHKDNLYHNRVEKVLGLISSAKPNANK